jgi:hypothetical protein
MSVNLASQEAEIRRIKVHSQHKQNIHKTPSQKILKAGCGGTHLSPCYARCIKRRIEVQA